ncbi:CHASE2 domain family [Polymorphum gilvum SL003B-26A1]|uniref:CHASE2 domain family n=1 Tax=Polymorphum gilvum (strain LMG 25793 / CGMCC 1.9160 / SL003B-26A1) TaxID=991905 RepID=F2J5W9_POLGS|nr:CHASE2 domain family [Polymorphum gilvum SL003B-26A1]
MLALALALALQVSGSLRILERSLAELRFSLLDRAPSGSIVLVEIDAHSLQEVGVWPWPRRLHAAMIDRLTQAGAGEIVLDIDFSAASSPDEDAALAAALERAGGGVSLAVFRQVAGSGSRADDMIVNRPIAALSDHSWPVVVSVPVETDGRVWNAVWGDVIDGEPVLSLPAVLSGRTGVIGERFSIDFSIDPDGIDRISAADLIAGRVSGADLAGRKAVIGATAQELRDLFSVPVHGILPGSVLQILAAESLLQDRAVRTAYGLETLVGAMLAGGLLIVLAPGGWRIRVAGVIGLLVVIEGAALGLLQLRPVMLDTAAAGTGLLMLAVLVVLGEIGLHKLLLRIARAQRRNSQAVLSRVFADSFDGIVVIDDTGSVRAATDSARAILGAALVEGEPADPFLPPEIGADVRQVLHGPDRPPGNPGLREIRVAVAGAAPRIVEYVVTGSVLADETGRDDAGGDETGTPPRVACVTCRDVTERRVAEHRVAYLARHDPVTGLINRTALEERLESILMRSRADRSDCVVILFSLDGLDNVVGSLGHGYGDALRAAVANRLRDLCRDPGLVASVGDNRFACVLEGVEQDDTGRFCDRLIDRMRRDFDLQGNRVHVSITLGVATAVAGNGNAQTLLRQAGTALSLARKMGVNQRRDFDAPMEQALTRRRMLELELWQALPRGQLRVAYQPQIRLSDGALYGAEALLRWEHPVHGPISPAEFIPIAEESGLIESLGTWVLNQACRDAAAWPQPIRLAVNVSPVQFLRGDLVSAVHGALDGGPFAAERLDLEIVETLFMGDDRPIREAVEALTGLGCSFALDDFGTGYSSLGYIPRFPLGKIKIDKCFVDGICTDPGSVAIVRSIVDLADSFGMTVVVEGVETPAQVDRLRELGCDVGQGYYFGRPQGAADIARRMQAAA